MLTYDGASAPNCDNGITLNPLTWQVAGLYPCCALATITPNKRFPAFEIPVYLFDPAGVVVTQIKLALFN